MDGDGGKWWGPVVVLQPGAVTEAVVHSVNFPLLSYFSGRAAHQSAEKAVSRVQMEKQQIHVAQKVD